MRGDIPKEFELWVCSHPKKCGWSGRHSELKYVPDPSMMAGATKGTCPNCGDNSFYVKDSRSFKKTAPQINWQQRAIEAEQISDELVKALTAEIINLQAAKQQAEQALEAVKLERDTLRRSLHSEMTAKESSEQKVRALEGQIEEMSTWPGSPLYHHYPYDLTEHERRYGSGENALRSEHYSQPNVLKVGDELITGDKVLSPPREGGNGRVLIHLTGGFEGHWIGVPARIPIALKAQLQAATADKSSK